MCVRTRVCECISSLTDRNPVKCPFRLKDERLIQNVKRVLMVK